MGKRGRGEDGRRMRGGGDVVERFGAILNEGWLVISFALCSPLEHSVYPSKGTAAMVGAVGP